MSKIDKIYIACSKRDLYFAKLCISSIRYWGINVPIELIVDHAWGQIDTTYLEKYWGVKRFESPYKIFKESYSKLEPLFENKGERIFTMDADIVLLGNMVADLEKIESTFICQKVYMAENDDQLNAWWFNTKKLKEWDHDYKYPGYAFYAGQLVTYDNIFTRNDFSDALEFGTPPKLKHPEIFLKNADQGLLNYIVEKKVAAGQIKTHDHVFFTGRYDLQALRSLKLEDIVLKKDDPKMIHYYGPKNGLLVNLPAEDILRFYEKYFYRYYSNPTLKYYAARSLRTLQHPVTYLKEFSKKIIKALINKR